MNTSTHLIWSKKKHKDITPDVAAWEYNSGAQKYDVTFKNGSVFSYSPSSLEILDDPEVLDCTLFHIWHNGRELFHIQNIRVFHGSSTDYWKIRFTNDTERCYDLHELSVVTSCLSDGKAKDCLSYLRQIAAVSELRADDGSSMLKKQYDRLEFVGDDTALAVYLNPEKYQASVYSSGELIFPFGGNASQFKAVEEALNNQISVIQGPPGTGKTQTILNIIANLLVRGKHVQIVSNNNSATANVLEKLSSPKYDMGFLVAPLGNAVNKSEFIGSQTGHYPDLSGWEMEADSRQALFEKIRTLSAKLSDIFKAQERLAMARQELEELLLEIKYFEQYCSDNGIEELIHTRRSLKSDRFMKLWQECYGFSEKEQPVSFWYKFKSVFIYGISNWRFYDHELADIITQLQNLFYQARRRELDQEISELLEKLESVNAEKKMEDLTKKSMKYLRAHLYDRFGGRSERVRFTDDDLWKRPNEVIKEYPVTLSTTFSSRSSLGDQVMYDYLIMDEASQVDVTTGALALSCARNAVIVGDLKQLPNVVSREMQERTETIWQSFQIDEGYSFGNNSFLKSICSVLPDVPQTLLREHYRCHPKIIGFCNQKFYNNELIVMTKDHGEKDTLSVYKTVEGSHKRGHFNQRQIDVVCQEALPELQVEAGEDIGIIAPYNEQVNAIRSRIGAEIDVATVHKFQGREKDTIVLTPVDDVVTDFSDDPYLLNVAVSRAKKRLCLVTSGNEQPADSNIGDLISYIEYHNFEVVQSRIYSVFDYLYRQYTVERMEYLKKHRRISAYDSENLMYAAICELLESHPELPLNLICHQQLNMLIRDTQCLNDDEQRYVRNPAAHVDFLIYNRIGKKAVCAIEVDGVQFHMDGTRQAERDKMKDHIFELYGIPLLRFATNGSGEKEQLERLLVTM